MPTTFTLTADEIAVLRRPVNGQGGFQMLIGDLNRAVQANGVDLLLDDTLLGRTIRYASYAHGGFQNRLKEAIRRNLDAILA